jgi:hypothetical protein
MANVVHVDFSRGRRAGRDGSAARRGAGNDRGGDVSERLTRVRVELPVIGMEFVVMARSEKDAFHRVWEQLDAEQRAAVESLEVLDACCC